MTLDHPDFAQLIRSSAFMKNVILIAIDELHCVSQWGEGFRKRYADLDRLRSFASCSVPFLSVTATAPPLVLEQIRSRLLFHDDSTLLINLGNDRRNLTMVMGILQGAARDPSALDFVLDEAHAGKPLKRTIIFFNSRELCLQGFKYLRSQLPEARRHEIDFLHALRTEGAKHCIMKKFQLQKVTVLCATEAAGMVRCLSD
jgi:superfamily II DNA helicase RecQ